MHTPGPWTLRTELINGGRGTCHMIGPFPSLGVRSETHACVYADCVRPHDYGHCTVGDELLADAKLIAAAPELLALANHILDMADDAYLIGHPEWIEIVNESRAAIAKAEGQ